MRPRTFTEKWDKEEREFEKGDDFGLRNKTRSLPNIWKRYLIYIIAIIIIFIIASLILSGIID